MKVTHELALPRPATGPVVCHQCGAEISPKQLREVQVLSREQGLPEGYLGVLYCSAECHAAREVAESLTPWPDHYPEVVDPSGIRPGSLVEVPDGKVITVVRVTRTFDGHPPTFEGYTRTGMAYGGPITGVKHVRQGP